MRAFDRALKQRFGVDRLRHNLLDAFPHVIRFGLSDPGAAHPSGGYTEMFYRALHRSRMLCAHLFGDETFDLNLAYSFDRRRSRGAAPWRDLEECGFEPVDAPQIRIPRAAEPDGFGDPVFPHEYAFRAQRGGAALHGLLWAVCAAELGVHPQPSGGCGGAPSVYVVSFAKGLIFHPYDDRGADLVCADAATGRAILSHFDDWVLDTVYDDVHARFA